AFHQNTDAALKNENLQAALRGMDQGLAEKRRNAIAALPNFQSLRDQAQQIKQHGLDHLDIYLEQFETNAQAAGAVIHWAADAKAANAIILDLAKAQNAKLITKGKSMASEEIGLNDALEQAGYKVLETDLGEYIIQLRGEAPSHIIAPAIHVLQSEIESLFKANHKDLDHARKFDRGVDLVREARSVLRNQYQTAEIGITGANFLIADTGQTVIVTNEGNGDLTQHNAKTHIVIAGIDKIVPSLEDAACLLRILARSATGQTMTSYNSFSLGSKRADDADGPQQMHIILLDNGRTEMLSNEFKPMLQCIRCAACMNVCPVYESIGGHAYGWVYPGPMGSVLTPNFIGMDQAHHLFNASSLCGRCAEVCPVKIPLPDLLRKWRIRADQAKNTPKTQRYGLKLWAFLASRPALYHLAGRISAGLMRLPLFDPILGMAAKGWLNHRNLARPRPRSFFDQYKAKMD
ncbi:MAG: LutB/LldF family L-lactate oxidation iron-sulfur protein, partial [Alphaproteobacteria bacterium]